jgi:SpoVK/Ycf46/Vps4 family AAA+-type ATPase
MLEYFQGILFLTTNRVATIDEAFQSRIDVHLNYPILDLASRKAVWRNFFSKSSRPIDVNDHELDDLAAVPLNGRQIKSVIKQSQLLSGSGKANPIKMAHLETVLRIMKMKEVC